MTRSVGVSLFALALGVGLGGRGTAQEGGLTPDVAVEAVSRAVEQVVVNYFARSMGTQARITEEFPLKLTFGPAGGQKGTPVRSEQKGRTVAGEASIEFDGNLEFDPVERPVGAQGAVLVQNPTGHFSPGATVEVAGAFVVDGLEVVATGDVALLGADRPIRFSDGLVVTVGGRGFAHVKGEWRATQ